jgi:hypothetical protein
MVTARRRSVGTRSGGTEVVRATVLRHRDGTYGSRGFCAGLALAAGIGRANEHELSGGKRRVDCRGEDRSSTNEVCIPRRDEQFSRGRV